MNTPMNGHRHNNPNDGGGSGDSTGSDATNDVYDHLEERILHYLSIYPVISPTMLQSALGPGLGPKIWRPVLEQMILEGKVIEEQVSLPTPAGRQNTYTKLRLPTSDVTSAA